MKKIITPLLALFLLLPFISLEAKTPKPVKLPWLTVTQTIEISAAPETVWGKIKDFNGLNTWHPAVAKCEILSGTNNQKNAVRLLTLQDGGTIKEKLLRYNNKGMSMKYNIIEGVLPVSNYVSTIRVKPGPKGGSLVEWYGKFHRKSPLASPPAGEDDATATKTINSVYKAGLDNLKKLVEGD
ncbi:MAG TPA: SRPBCC family protein [Burkholderiales bacterium]|nr:SRPBCC family protein [Burkholderiales bacterium]